MPPVPRARSHEQGHRPSRDPGPARRRRRRGRRVPLWPGRAARRLRRRRRLLRDLRLPDHLAPAARGRARRARSRCRRSGRAARAASCPPRCSCCWSARVGDAGVRPGRHWEQFFAEIRASALYVQNWQLAARGGRLLRRRPTAPRRCSTSGRCRPRSSSTSCGRCCSCRGRRARSTARRRDRAVVLIGALTAREPRLLDYETARRPGRGLLRHPDAGVGVRRGRPAGAAAAGAARRPRRAPRARLGRAGRDRASPRSPSRAQTAFPGYAALAAGARRARRHLGAAPARALGAHDGSRAAPVQFLGDISYSRLPVALAAARSLAPYAIARGVDTATSIACSCSRSLLAWLTKRFIEDPVRRGRFLIRRPPRWTFACAASATALVLAVTARRSVAVRARGAAGRARLAARSSPRTRSASAPPRATRASVHATRALRLRSSRRRSRRTSGATARARCSGSAGYLYVCGFGVEQAQGDGDRRADRRQPRRALARGARTAWRKRTSGTGYSLSHTGCPLSTRRREPAGARPHGVRRAGTRRCSRGSEARTRRSRPCSSRRSPAARRDRARAQISSPRDGGLPRRVEGAAAPRSQRDRRDPRHAEGRRRHRRLRAGGDRPHRRRPGRPARCRAAAR